jgi:hypothetical protein
MKLKHLNFFKMEVYHLSSSQVDDTYLGINYQHTQESWRIKVEDQLSNLRNLGVIETVTRKQKIERKPSVRENLLSRSQSAERIQKFRQCFSEGSIANFNEFSNNNTNSIAIQTEGIPLIQKSLNDMKETREWSSSFVDPFIKVILCLIQNCKLINIALLLFYVLFQMFVFVNILGFAESLNVKQTRED